MLLIFVQFLLYAVMISEDTESVGAKVTCSILCSYMDLTQNEIYLSIIKVKLACNKLPLIS